MKQLAARERKARIAAYLQYLKSRPATPTSPPRVIADGDSWFDYPEILLAGGGNDIAGDQFCLWLKPNTRGGAASAVDAGRLQEILGVVEDGYRNLIDIRDRCAPDCWIVTHAYDFPQPRDKGVCGLGP